MSRAVSDNKVRMRRRCPAYRPGRPPDGGWSWVVLFASAMNLGIIAGIAYSYGVFLPEIMDYYKSIKGTAAWASSVQFGIVNISGPLASSLTAVFGYRKVAVFGALLSSVALFSCTFCHNIGCFITVYGIGSGFGCGCTYFCSVVITNSYFDEKRARALGICLCGAGIGQFAVAPLVEYLIQTYTWRGAMWITSGLLLNCVMLSCLFRPMSDHTIVKSSNSKEETEAMVPCSDDVRSSDCITDEHMMSSGTTKGIESSLVPTVDHDGYSSANISDSMSSVWTPFCSVLKKAITDTCQLQIMRNPALLLFGMSNLILSLGYFVPFTYFPLMAMGVGVTGGNAAFLLSIIGITTSVGRLLVGQAVDRFRLDMVILYSVAAAITGIWTALVPLFTNYALLATYSVVFGVCSAIITCAQSLSCIEIAGADKMAAAYGYVMLNIGVTAFIGSPIAGSIADWTGNFDASFYFGGGVFILAGLVGCVVKLFLRNRR